MRILFPLWGLIAGFWLGVELVHAITGDGFFGTTLAIVVGIAFALIGAVFAYFYFAVSVIFFMGLVGYWLGAGFITLLGFHIGVISTIVGLSLAALFILSAFIGNAPKFYLLILTAFGGAAVMLAGVLVLINVADLSDLQDGAFAVVADSPQHPVFWQLVLLALGVVGYATQLASSREAELQWKAEWQAAMKGEGK